ncbi:hypothetical protein AMAG_12128 [Allomyces macrogynus ATCC 38327]|uniref:G-protein coupled receptors family 2 profile 2 domain-containing protein n=1 Tax=Allomyces macrogynus (strain ATCC 38327) TaxID=578462 RepID=A0A0L0SXC7_ALLM3|nr:hypothetical protein AMAG_12128 [Allomyces macrogynus ATCC 38327]|eukprot:KNE67050.1 hypothetical protein AMAG_12128 [Allomyces macrogynus ATCC 38327]
MVDDASLTTLSTIARVSASLSVIGSLGIIIDTIRKHRAARSTAHALTSSRVILWWSIADLVYVPAVLLGRSAIKAGSVDSVLCSAQGWMLQFSYTSSALWAAMMATSSYLVVKRWFHTVAWGVPLLLATVPLLVGAGDGERFYADATFWCWISTEWSAFRLYIFYGPIWACFLYCLVMYYLVGRRVWEVFREIKSMGTVTSTIGGSTPLPPMTNSGTHLPPVPPPPAAARRAGPRLHARHRFALKTGLYLASFFLVYSAATANRISTLINPDSPILVLEALQCLFLPLQGFLNGAIYFSTKWLAHRQGGLLQGSSDETSSTDVSANASATGRSTAGPPYMVSVVVGRMDSGPLLPRPGEGASAHTRKVSGAGGAGAWVEDEQEEGSIVVPYDEEDEEADLGLVLPMTATVRAAGVVKSAAPRPGEP